MTVSCETTSPFGWHTGHFVQENGCNDAHRFMTKCLITAYIYVPKDHSH